MDNYKVQLSVNSYNIKLSPEPKYKVTTVYSGSGSVAESLGDLTDVEQTTATDKYVLVWDSNTQKATWVNPDVVLNNAAQYETTQPGFGTYTEPFINALDVALDNKISFDEGEY
jgi:hypothetical protein